MKGVPLVGLLCGFCSVASLAQSNTIKLYALSAVAGRAGVAYERAINNYVTLQMGVEYGSYADGVFVGRKDYNLIALNIVPEIRFYPLGQMSDVPYRFFIGETFRYSAYRETYEDLLRGGVFPIEAHSTVLSFDLDMGFKFLYKRFSFEAVMSYGLINELKLDDKRRFIGSYTDGLLVHQNGFYDENDFLRLRVLLGYTFPKRSQNQDD